MCLAGVLLFFANCPNIGGQIRPPLAHQQPNAAHLREARREMAKKVAALAIYSSLPILRSLIAGKGVNLGSAHLVIRIWNSGAF
jgi:hypothetical protein